MNKNKEDKMSIAAGVVTGSIAGSAASMAAHNISADNEEQTQHNDEVNQTHDAQNHSSQGRVHNLTETVSEEVNDVVIAEDVAEPLAEPMPVDSEHGQDAGNINDPTEPETPEPELPEPDVIVDPIVVNPTIGGEEPFIQTEPDMYGPMIDDPFVCMYGGPIDEIDEPIDEIDEPIDEIDEPIDVIDEPILMIDDLFDPSIAENAVGPIGNVQPREVECQETFDSSIGLDELLSQNLNGGMTDNLRDDYQTLYDSFNDDITMI